MPAVTEIRVRDAVAADLASIAAVTLATGQEQEWGGAGAGYVTHLLTHGRVDGQAVVCLPGPHPAVRPLLAAGWRVAEFDLYMATEPGLLDPSRAVPSPALA